jgi:hypothetical protein
MATSDKGLLQNLIFVLLKHGRLFVLENKYLSALNSDPPTTSTATMASFVAVIEKDEYNTFIGQHPINIAL